MPRWPDKEQTPVGQDKSVILPASGSIVQAVENLKDIEIVDKPMQDSYAEELAFMEEKLEVVVNEDTNPNAENPVQISVNGVNQFFMRGQPQVVKRKFVEVLARAKRTVVTTPEVNDGNGARTMQIRQQSSLRYPFQVMNDPNPKGAPWLRALMSEAH